MRSFAFSGSSPIRVRRFFLAFASLVFVSYPALAQLGGEQLKPAGAGPRQVKAADLNGDGSNDLIVANHDGKNVSVFLSNGHGAFGTPASFPVNKYPVSVDAVDINNDGKVDLVVANDRGNSLATGSIYVFVGDGAGNFVKVKNIAFKKSWGDPSCVAAGDVNGDGLADIVVASATKTNVIYFLQNATENKNNDSGDDDGQESAIHFSAAKSLDMGGAQSWLVLSDLNNDGRLDGAAALANVANIAVRLHGTGPSIPLQKTLFAAGNSPPRGLASGDINHDGQIDLFTASSDGSGFLLAGDGTGNFTTAPFGALGGNVANVTVGDCNLDGFLDLLSANGGAPSTEQHLAIALNFGNGKVASPIEVPITGAPVHVQVTDLDGLDANDVVAVSPDTGFISFFLASPLLTLTPGPLVFSGSQISAGGQSARTLIAGDYNGDLFTDVITANEGSNTLSFIPGKLDGGIGNITTIPTGPAPRIVIDGDLNMDGFLDLVVARANSGAEIYVNDGAGGFSLTQVLDTSARLSWIAIVELNNDGRPDIVGAESGHFDIWLNDGIGGFGNSVPYALPAAGPCNFAFGDLDQDGAFDAAAVFLEANSCALLFGNDVGSFGKLPTVTFPVAAAPVSVVFGYFDHDPFSDIAIASYGAGIVTVKHGDGAGGFLGTPTIINNLGTPASLLAFDFSNDGVQDLVTNDPAGGLVRLLINDIQGAGFLPADNYRVETAALADDLAQGTLAHGAFNGDVAQDLAVLNGKVGNNRVAYYLNRGDGKFGVTDVALNDIPNILSVGDFNKDSTLDFLVGGSSGLLRIFKGDQTPASTLAEIQLPSALTAAEIADFDLDGVLDAAVAGANGNIYILRGQLADGIYSFALLSSIPTGGVRSLAVADLNGDEKPDIMICSTGPQINILLAAGNAQFNPPTTHPLSGPGDSICVADVNHDGFRDVAVVHESADNIQILYGDGLGGIVSDSSIQMPAPTRMAFRDMNTDGKTDLVAVSLSLRRVYVVLFDANSEPSSYLYIPLSEEPSALAIADFDADTNIDVIVTHTDSGMASLLYGDGKGAFRAVSRFPVGAHPVAILAGTIDVADTRTDILVASSGPSAVSLLNGFGASFYKFSGNSSNCATGTPKAAAVGDLNKDGNKDTASVQKGSNSVNVTINNTPQGNVCKGPYAVGTQPSALVITDVNKDSNNDLVVTNFGSNNVSILLGDGTGELSAAVSYPAGTSPTSVRVSDSNGDGNVDLMITNGTTPGGVTIILGNGDGTFGLLATTGNIGSNLSAMETGDLNLDGSLDLLISSTGDNTVITGETTPFGFGATTTPMGFTQTAQISVGNRPLGLAVADFNHDGLLDVVTANELSNNISILLGADDSFGFASPAHHPAGTSPRGVVARDFNYDGIVDFVTGNGGSNNATLLFGDGAGGVSMQFTVPLGEGGDPEGIAVGDLENDARWDFVLPRNDGVGGVVTSIINLTPNPVGVTYYGSGTPGCFGPHTLRANSVPKIGNFIFSFLCTNAPPNSLGLGIVTDIPDFDGGVLPGLEVDTWIDIFAATELFMIDFHADHDGFAVGKAAIRNIPELVGKHLFAQSFFVWGHTCMPSQLGLSSSNALQIVIQP